MKLRSGKQVFFAKVHQEPVTARLLHTHKSQRVQRTKTTVGQLLERIIMLEEQMSQVLQAQATCVCKTRCDKSFALDSKEQNDPVLHQELKKHQENKHVQSVTESDLHKQTNFNQEVSSTEQTHVLEAEDTCSNTVTASNSRCSKICSVQ